MTGPHKNFPLTQREFHEQAAAIAYQPKHWPDLAPQFPDTSIPPDQYMPRAAPNPFVRNPALVKEEP